MTDPILGEMSDEESCVIAYRFRARMYLTSHIEEIKDKYTESIYKELCVQNPQIEKYYYGQHGIASIVGPLTAKKIIKEHIIYSDEYLILYNPKSKEPAVIKDAYELTEYDIDAFEEQILIAYKQRHRLEEDSYATMEEIGKFVGAQASSGIIDYSLARMGSRQLVRADRLSVLAKHYDGGHKSRMRLERSVRGKKNQRKAWTELFAKNKRLTKMARTHKALGKSLKFFGGSTKLAKNFIPTPISIEDAWTNVEEINRGSASSEREKSRMSVLINDELEKYCNKHNNYIWIIKQQYFEQG